MKLMDRIAVVTGAGSGIGRATASMFAREGARVAVVDLEEATAKATVEEIERAGGHALAIRADVSKAADNEAVVGQTLARWGRLDIFFESAPFGVRVVAIAPVATETPMLATFMGKTAVDEEGMTRYRATVPLGRLNTPDDLARVAVFLASDDSAMITGTCIEVDGGRCI